MPSSMLFRNQVSNKSQLTPTTTTTDSQETDSQGERLHKSPNDKYKRYVLKSFQGSIDPMNMSNSGLGSLPARYAWRAAVHTCHIFPSCQLKYLKYTMFVYFKANNWEKTLSKQVGHSICKYTQYIGDCSCDCSTFSPLP